MEFSFIRPVTSNILVIEVQVFMNGKSFVKKKMNGKFWIDRKMKVGKLLCGCATSKHSCFFLLFYYLLYFLDK